MVFPDEWLDSPEKVFSKCSNVIRPQESGPIAKVVTKKAQCVLIKCLLTFTVLEYTVPSAPCISPTLGLTN